MAIIVLRSDEDGVGGIVVGGVGDRAEDRIVERAEESEDPRQSVVLPLSQESLSFPSTYTQAWSTHSRCKKGIDLRELDCEDEETEVFEDIELDDGMLSGEDEDAARQSLMLAH